MTPPRKNHTALRVCAYTLGLLCVVTLGFFAWQSFYPVSAANGWRVQVVHRDVPKAASLMPLADGSLMVSQELDDAQGSIVRIHPDGTREVVVANLSKPEGVVRELTDDGSDPVVLSHLNQPTFLMCDERGLWVNEDATHRARLLLIDKQGRQQTILSFLKAPQSIVPTGHGTYLLAEGGRDRVLELTPE